MSFKDFIHINEGLVKVPVDEIRKWVDSHFEEFKAKLKETLTKGYNTDINDYIAFVNPYNQEKMEVGVEIQKNILSSGGVTSMLYFDPKTRMITISATGFLNEFKKNLKEGLISSIIHELTHAIDPGFTKKKLVVNNPEDYINSDRETVAFNREFIDRIQHLPSDKQKLVLDRIRMGKKLGIRDIDDYLSSLTPENKMKFIKYLVKELIPEKHVRVKNILMDALYDIVEPIIGEAIDLKKYTIIVERKVTPDNIDSTAIMQAGYSRMKKELYLRFTGNPTLVYVFQNFPRRLKDKFKLSPSKGQFFHQFIRDKFPVSKILGG